VERFIELPSSAYTLVNGSSCPIFSALPGVAVAAAVAATVGLGEGVAAGPQAAARATAPLAARNFRRESR
jgi:ABC-type proline/glycine betaine transport system permease subunit